MTVAKSLYIQREKNIFKTWLIMALFIALFASIGMFLAYYYKNVNIFYGAIAISICMNFFSYWYSDKLALSSAGAVEVKSKSQYSEYWNVVENLSITAGLPMPKIHVINDPIPNAFATGRNKNHASIAATTGLLSMLNKTELEGVMAHELSHIKNKDILLQTMIVIMVSAITFLAQIFTRFSMFGGMNSSEERQNSGGVFMLIGSVLSLVLAPIAATIIQMAISRRREFLADASGAILTRYPEGLASALAKISQFSQPLQNATPATSHLYIVNPMGLNGTQNTEIRNEKIPWYTRLFMTHPPTGDRINALLSMKD